MAYMLLNEREAAGGGSIEKWFCWGRGGEED
jgi:hypothetical protein